MVVWVAPGAFGPDVGQHGGPGEVLVPAVGQDVQQRDTYGVRVSPVRPDSPSPGGAAEL